MLLEVERLDEARAERERCDRLTFVSDARLLDINPELATVLPDLSRRLETIYRCVYRLDAILPLLRVADLGRKQLGAGNDLAILREYTMGGLRYAAEVLTDTIMRGLDALSSMEVRHG